MKLQAKTLLVTIYFFIFGISIGTFMEVALSSQEKSNLLSGFAQQVLTEPPHGGQLPSIFLHSLENNVGILALIALAGVSLLGFPAAIALVTYKGVALGFTAALILELFPEKGAFLILVSIIPQNFFILPALIMSAQQATVLALGILSSKKSNIKKSLTTNAGPYFSVQLCLCLIAMLGCIIEAFICPFLIQLIKLQ